MLDELSVLRLVVARLEAAGFAYMVTGSVAASLYAEPRMTRDVDLVVELSHADATRLVDLFGAEFDCDADRIREAIARQSMFNLIHTSAVVKIDIIVRKDSAYRLEEFRRRRAANIGGVPMWVVSPEARPAERGSPMNDTPPEVREAFVELLMQRSEGERAMMAFEMFDMARTLMTADIRTHYPDITETELRVRVFERTYGSDFDEADRARIVQRIRTALSDR